MDEKLQILIIEDEELNIEILKMMISELGHEIVGVAVNFEEALKLLETTKPDLALVDILLKEDKDGIFLAQHINLKYNFPFIYTTSLADKDTVRKAKLTQPDGYLVKPFTKEDLYTAIEVAMFNYNRKQNKDKENQIDVKHNKPHNQDVFIKDGHKLIKINIQDIIYIKAEGNYIMLHFNNKKHLVKSSMRDFMEKIPCENFFQVHKSYIINLKYINAISGNMVVVNGNHINVSRTYRDKLIKHIETF